MFIKGVTLIDSQERGEKNPDTWESPSERELRALKVGDFVKIGLEGYNKILNTTSKSQALGGERFWTEVTSIKGSQVTGEVQNHLMNYKIPVGFPLEFETRHILEIMTSEEMIMLEVQSMNAAGASPEEIEQFITKSRT